MLYYQNHYKTEENTKSVNIKVNKGATWRAILIGSILLPLNVYWLTVAEMKYGSQATALPLFIYPVFILFCLVVCNVGLGKLWPTLCLSTGELLTIYVMQVIASSLSAYGMLQDLFAVIVHPYRFASPENEWKNLFFHHIPANFTVSLPDVLVGYYQGDSTFYQLNHLLSWVRPFVTWASFTLVLLLMMHCLNTLFRRQWIQHERLAFPIIQLPVTMVQSPYFFRNRMLWLGFGIVAILDALNGLHTLFPAVPYLQLKLINISQYFTEKPWNLMGTTRVSFYPFMIGIGFFLPLDLSFSCWFFFLLRQLSRVFSGYIGIHHLPGFPYFHEQSAGAWICLAFIALWLTRKHLVFALQFAWSGNFGTDMDEPMRYRTAFLGLGICSLFLLGFGFRVGMSITAVLLFFGIYFAIAIAITRLRAEFGAPHGIFNHPLDMMVTTFGSKSWGAGNLTVMSFFFWFNRGYRPHPMPNQFEALKIADTVGMQNRRLLLAMIIAGLLSLICSFWSNLDMMYRDGALAKVTGFRFWVGRGAFAKLEKWLLHPVSPDWLRIGFMGMGALLTLTLLVLRIRFFWWPLHPAGYSLAVSFAIDYFWFPFLISWSLKSIILKSGGIRGYQQAVPFFFGLILGDFVVGSLWMVFGMLAQQHVYTIFI